MSWLNFNESLSSIKGQLSSFASGVLADGIVGETENDVTPTKNKIDDLEDRQKIRSTELQAVAPTDSSENANNWSWEPPGGPPRGPSHPSLILDLQKKVDILENEKKELIVSLEQLDLDCQQTTDKLVTLKDNLQTSYNELKADFEKLQREYGEVLTENMDKSKEIQILKAEDSKKPVEERIRSLQEENRLLNTKLTRFQNEKETHDELVQKYEELKKNYENHRGLSTEEKIKNEELQKLYNKLEEENAKLRIKIEEYGEKTTENDELKVKNGDLIKELQQLKFEIEEIKDAKNKLENEENKNEKLKIVIKKLENDMEQLKKDKEILRIECEKLKNKEETIKEKTNEDNLKITIEKYQLELEQLRSVNEQMKINQEDIMKKQNEHQEIKSKFEQLNINNEKLITEHENLKLFTEQLKKDFEQIQNSSSATTQKLLDKEKEALHEKYLSIITENMRKYIDMNTEESSTFSFVLDEPQILEFSGKVETLLKLLLDFKVKTETLEKDLCQVTQEKNKIIAEKNFEIEKLLKNSEILSQEVITKTQAIKDYEDECGELMKNNDMLISELQNYKNSSGLQTISESNEDNLLLLETQLENANKKIQDMELIISDLENSKQETNLETQTELDYIKKQLNMTGQELNHSKEEHQSLILRHKQLEDEKQNLKSVLDKIKLEYENTEYKYTEVNVSMETLKEENEEYKNKIHDLENNHMKFEAVKFNFESKIELLQNVVDDLKQKLEVEMENTSQKDLQIRNLIERLQNAKMCETGLKLQVDTIYKELQVVSEAKQALEIKYTQGQNKLQEVEEELAKIKEEYNRLQEKSEDKLKNGENINTNEEVNKEDPIINCSQLKNQEDALITSQLQKQLESAYQEKLIIETECSKLRNDFSQVTQQNQDLFTKVKFLETQITEVTNSRNELVGLITAKHQENIQYHGEIQRLNHFLAQETEKAHILEIQLHNLKTQPIESSSEELLQKNEELTLKIAEIEKLTDQNTFLREKCEVLAQNLLQEQSNVQKVISERLTASDKEQSLAKELERLRAHLVEIEEMYTQELLQAEQKNKEMMVKVNEIEQREKDSSSIYTSVSIRANQQVETLHTQLQLVTNQRDELRIKVSDLEDENNKQVAALTNLQLVLEQFQKERDKDVYQETERVRRQVTVERQIQQELRNEICSLRLQLEESKQGLQAASRLTDQLEKCKQQIVNYKDEVIKLQEQVKNKEAKLKELTTQTDSKVDKILIKNLIIGFITSHSNDQNQILKIIATVLDFNQAESDKVNLNKQQLGGWLNSILHPQSLNSTQDNMIQQESLSEAFVRFLEKESKPKVLPNLLITNQVKKADGSGSSSSTTPRQSPSPRVLSEVVLPTFVDFGKSRNSSSILKDVLKDNS